MGLITNISQIKDVSTINVTNTLIQWQLYLDEAEETFIPIQNEWNMANIMFTAGIFSSVTQARKNGWNKPIPEGFSDMRVGKTKLRLVIFKEIQIAREARSS